MISKILVIMSGGTLCYSKTFIGKDQIDDDLISGFLTAISNIAQEIGGGEIKSLYFRNFNFIYSYDEEKICMFVIITDIEDPEDEARAKLDLLISEFMKRYGNDFKNWNCEVARFTSFDEFAETHIFIPPKILLIGEPGVGKSTILNLFPGEIIIELDDDLIEIIQKSIQLPVFQRINEVILREMDMQELIDNSKIYRPLLDRADIICIVTNSGASNLGRTNRMYSLLKEKVKKADFYVIANFQDLETTSFEPQKIEDMFGVRTFGLSAIKKEAEAKIYDIISEMVKTSIVEKIISKET